MALTQDQVRKIAKLARIALTDEEVDRLSRELTNVLDYVEILNEIDTDNVEPTSQVTGLSNVMEEDVLRDYKVSREELLDCSELPVDSGQVKVIKVVK